MSVNLYAVLCVTVFLTTYVLHIVTITVGYHRGLAHNAVKLHPFAKKLLVTFGNWVTGIDAKSWVVMHRLHHLHSDTPQDPHSPRNGTLLGVFFRQIQSYDRIRTKLSRADRTHYADVVADLDFPVNPIDRMGLWPFTYVVHVGITAALGWFVGWELGAAYFLGMMSHPVTGGLVNSLGHAWGSRNFNTPDDSRNNHPVAWFVGGEGYQNNHHQYPASARFSYRPLEIDPGWAAVRILDAMHVVTIQPSTLMPRAGSSVPKVAQAPVPQHAQQDPQQLST